MIDLADSFRPVSIAVVETCQRIYDDFVVSVSDMYDGAGRPYGDDEAEMWRWIEEQFGSATH